MSQYPSPSSENSSKGLQVLAVLAGLIILGFIQIRNDQKLLKLTPGKEGGVIVTATVQEWLNPERHLMAAAYSAEGKQLWKRQYKPTFSPEELERTLLIPGEEGWELYTENSLLRLDTKGRLKELRENIPWEESRMLQEVDMTQEQNREKDQSRDLIEGDFRYRLQEDSHLVKIYREEELQWTLDPQIELAFLGKDPRDLSLWKDSKGDVRISMTLTAEKEDFFPYRERPFRFSITLNGEEGWNEEGFQLEGEERENLNTEREDYSYLYDGQLSAGEIHYSIRKGLVKAESPEGDVLWKKRAYFPVLALLENFF